MLPTPHSQPQNSQQAQSPAARDASDELHILVADHDPLITRAVSQMAGPLRVVVHHAATRAQTRSIAAGQTIDVAMIDLKLPDGSGLELAEELRRDYPGVGAVVVLGRASYHHALDAMRAGACDYLRKPLTPTDVNECLARIIRRRADQQRVAERLVKLRDLCRKLNKARHQMTQQVDSLCSDMASAYKDMAGQVKHAQLTARFKALVGHELDLEKVLRRFLEIVLQEVGPTNAVVFLPSTQGQFAVGGYINYNLDKANIEAMLGHLAESVGPQIANSTAPVSLDSAQAIEHWLGSECPWLAGQCALALPCRHEEEVMAGVLLFRDAAGSYEPGLAQALGAVAPVLAAHLTRVIRIHHRLRPDPALDQGDGTDPDDVQF